MKILGVQLRKPTFGEVTLSAVMAAGHELDLDSDMADLFLEELNRLWAEGPVETAA